MGLQAVVLKYRDTILGPEAVVVVEAAEKGGYKGVFLVLHSIESEGSRRRHISTFRARADAELVLVGRSIPSQRIKYQPPKPHCMS